MERVDVVAIMAAIISTHVKTASTGGPDGESDLASDIVELAEDLYNLAVDYEELRLKREGLEAGRT